MLPHPLKSDAYAHLTAGDGRSSVEKIEIRELAINAVIDDVYRLKTMIEGVVYYNYPLKCSALNWQRSDRR